MRIIKLRSHKARRSEAKSKSPNKNRKTIIKPNKRDRLIGVKTANIKGKPANAGEELRKKRGRPRKIQPKPTIDHNNLNGVKVSKINKDHKITKSRHNNHSVQSKNSVNNNLTSPINDIQAPNSPAKSSGSSSYAKKFTALRKFASGVIRPSAGSNQYHHNYYHHQPQNQFMFSNQQKSTNSGLNSPMKSTDSASENSEPLHDFFPKDYQPETEDFLTFLCLRLPPSLCDEHDNDNGTDSHDSNAILSPSQTRAMRWIQTLRINCLNELKSMNLYNECTVFPPEVSKNR